MLLSIIVLSWSLVTTDISNAPLKVDGYNVYRRRANATSYGKAIAYRTLNKYSSNTYHGYCFAVKAVAGGVVSQRSNEKCVK